MILLKVKLIRMIFFLNVDLEVSGEKDFVDWHKNV